MLSLSSADFFLKTTFLKILSEIPSECQTDCIQIRLDKMSDLVWVKTVCKGYQQMTLGGKELKVNKVIEYKSFRLQRDI